MGDALNSFKKLHNLFKLLIAVLAFFPGVAVYSELVEAPPDFVGAAKIIALSIAIMALVCVPLFSEKIMARAKGTIAILAIAGVVLGGISLIAYVGFAKTHIFSGETLDGERKFIIPLYPEPETQAIVDMMGPPQMARQERYSRGIESGEGEQLIANLNSDSWDSFVLMVVLLILSQVLLVVPPVAAAWRLAPETGAKPDADKDGDNEGDVPGA